ncbi:hypothetical protein BPO_1628 [Bergeyella porcorum]|uniref:Uncharacterized protein n=1 Tax=Bergeyella porcorum TaxID=1735111 RepID=A0AAU0F2H3_9FLAO
MGEALISDADELREKAKKLKWNPEVQQHFEKELARLQRQHPNSPDYNVQRNYLDFFTIFALERYSKDAFDIAKAEKTLDKATLG